METRATDNTRREVEVEEGKGVASRTGGDVEAVRLHAEGWWWNPERRGKGASATQEEEVEEEVEEKVE